MPVSVAVERVVRKNPELYIYFNAIDNVVCAMATNKNFDPTVLVNEVNRVTQPLIKNADANLAKETIITLYKIFYSDRLRSDISEDQFLLSLTTVLCDSIKTGLANSGVTPTP